LGFLLGVLPLRKRAKKLDVPHLPAEMPPPHERNVLNAARTSWAKSSGSSQAASWRENSEVFPCHTLITPSLPPRL